MEEPIERALQPGALLPAAHHKVTFTKPVPIVAVRCKGVDIEKNECPNEDCGGHPTRNSHVPSLLVSDAEIAGKDEKCYEEKSRHGELKEPLCPWSHGAVLALHQAAEDRRDQAEQRGREQLGRLPFEELADEIPEARTQMLVTFDERKCGADRANQGGENGRSRAPWIRLGCAPSPRLSPTSRRAPPAGRAA